MAFPGFFACYSPPGQLKSEPQHFSTVRHAAQWHECCACPLGGRELGLTRSQKVVCRGPSCSGLQSCHVPEWQQLCSRGSVLSCRSLSGAKLFALSRTLQVFVVCTLCFLTPHIKEKASHGRTIKVSIKRFFCIMFSTP